MGWPVKDPVSKPKVDGVCGKVSEVKLCAPTPTVCVGGGGWGRQCEGATTFLGNNPVPEVSLSLIFTVLSSFQHL